MLKIMISYYLSCNFMESVTRILNFIIFNWIRDYCRTAIYRVILSQVAPNYCL